MRLSKYLTVVRDGDRVVIFNALNGAMICLDEEREIDALERCLKTQDPAAFGEPLLRALRESRFLFDDYEDETELAKRNFLELYRRASLLRLLVYVTEDCNFRCAYCPQVHKPKHMAPESVDRIVEFARDQLRGGGFKSLYVSWFGGEPLLNLPVIERGMRSLRALCGELDVAFSAGMTTNGYALGRDTVTKLLSLGVCQYQITVDGMPETHNAHRRLRDGGGTWERIWSNLLCMQSLDEQFSVSLRVNANNDTLPSAREFISLASKRLDRRFAIQTQPISNMGNTSPEAQALYCSMEEANNVRSELDEYAASQRGDSGGRCAMLRPFGLMCSSFTPGYFVITVDCDICKCELQINDARNRIGSLMEKGRRINTALLASFVTPESKRECEECRLYPMCYGLSCPYRKVMNQPCDFASMAYAVETQIIRCARALLKNASQSKLG